MSGIDVAVIVVSWNVREYLANCLRSVCTDMRQSGLNGRIWVVDNDSTDGTVDLLDNLFPHVKVIANKHNVGFGAANNQGMKAAATDQPRFFFLLNPDTLVRPGATRHLVECLDSRPNAGMAGARLVYGDGRFQHSAFRFPGLGQLLFDLFPFPGRLYESRWNGRYPHRAYHPDCPPFAVDHPLGATMLVRADVAEATNGFDESYHMYCEEIDWCWRIKQAGWDIYTVPAAEVVHYGGESTKQIPAQSVINLWRSRAQLYRQHHGRFKQTAATWLVRKAMNRRARRENNPDLKRAYEKVVDIWDTGSVTQVAVA